MGAIRRVGRLRHRVAIEEQTAALDTLGRKPRGGGAWTFKKNIMAEVIELSGRDLELAKQKISTATHRVTTRALSWLSTKHRLKYGDRVLEISAVTDGDGTGRELILICGEVK